MKLHYRDEKSGEIRFGTPPDHHPAHYYSDKNRKKVSKGHLVRFKKVGDKENAGRVTSFGDHGAVIQSHDGTKHKVLHHEIIEHIGGKANFGQHKDIGDLGKAMIDNAQARGNLPALEGAIALLKGLSSYDNTNKFNQYRYKLEALRNRILTGNDIPSQDINNMNMLISQAGSEVTKTNQKSIFKLKFKR